MTRWEKKLVSGLAVKWNVELRPLLGLELADTTLENASVILADLIERFDGPPRVVLFVHTKTLSLALDDPRFSGILNQADLLFGDGTGVRWAFRIAEGRQPRDNVNGTDLIPKLLGEAPRGKYGVFLLGGREDMLEKSAMRFEALFPGCILRGHHHGYFPESDNDRIIRRINESGSQILLVGMGSPIQENWILSHSKQLAVPLVISVGGLFNYWAGELDRAPLCFRRIGIEWIYILLQQPAKWRRYLLDGPAFLMKIYRMSVKNKRTQGF